MRGKKRRKKTICQNAGKKKRKIWKKKLMLDYNEDYVYQISHFKCLGYIPTDSPFLKAVIKYV